MSSIVHAEVMIRLLKTVVAVIPREDHTDDLFDDLVLPHFETRGQLIAHLLDRFQSNSLFTPEVAKSHPEIEVMTNRIALNTSWPIDDVVSRASDETFHDRLNICRNLVSVRPDCTTEHVVTLIGEPEDRDEMLFQLRAETQEITLAESITEITRSGGFIRTVETLRTVENLLQNSHLPFGFVITLASRTGVPDAATEWPKNPFQYPFATMPYLYPISWFRNENRDNLTELLCIVKTSFPLVMSLLDSDPEKHAPAVYDCVVFMMATNPAWDADMESRFGDTVWPLLWKVLGIVWEGSENDFADEMTQTAVKEYLQHYNPSWRPSDLMRGSFEWECLPPFMECPVSRKYRNKCSCIMFPSREDFLDIYRERFAMKSCLSVRDIREFMQSTDVPLHVLEMFAENASVKGDAAMKIARTVYHKYVLPQRRMRIRSYLEMYKCDNKMQCTGIVENIQSFMYDS